MRHPGIEPGAPRWQRGILPLNQWRFDVVIIGQQLLHTCHHNHLLPKMVFEVGFEPTPPKRLVP